MKYYLAIDIGASSGRHIVGWQDGDEIRTAEVYRFKNGVRREGGHLTWDIDGIYEEVLAGIRAAFSLYPKIESLAIDTWGVDYVLLRNEETMYPVYAYRDARGEAAVDAVHGVIDFAELYRRTGCQHQPFNTIYQLWDDKLSGRLDEATDLLMIPEYLAWRLSGVKAREYTNATTTGLINAESGEFDGEILAALAYPARLFPRTVRPGTVLGGLLPDVSRAVGGDCQVVLSATHDTASAVEGIPMQSNSPYISSGTWSLLGVKTERPLTDGASLAANYSNEGGVGYNRYQKNIMGMWVVNELWRELCPDLPISEVVRLAEESKCQTVIDVNAPEFLAPESMRAAFDRATGGFANVGDYFRSAYLSLAKSYASSLAELEANTKRKYEEIYVVGGGAKNAFLNRLTEEAAGCRVIALPIEATALGNLKIQIRRGKNELH